MKRCPNCLVIFHSGLAVQSVFGGGCPVCNTQLSQAPLCEGFDGTVQSCLDGHVVPAHPAYYRDLLEEAVLLATKEGADYYYLPISSEYLVVQPGGRVASGGREFKSGPVAEARRLHVERSQIVRDYY